LTGIVAEQAKHALAGIAEVGRRQRIDTLDGVSGEQENAGRAAVDAACPKYEYVVGIAAAGKLRHPMVMEQVGSSSTIYEEDLLLSGRSLSQSHPNLQPDAGYACRRLERVSRALVNSQTACGLLAPNQPLH